MRKQIILVLLFLSYSVLTTAQKMDTKSDSLTFVQTDTDKKVLVTKGMLVEALTNDRQKIIGEFNGGSNTTLQIKQKGNVEKLMIPDIKKITVYKEGSKDAITGSVRFIVGASSATSLLLGVGAAAGGIATINNSKVLGVGLIGASIPLIYYGIKLHFMLKNADREVIKMNKGWTVAIP